MKRSFNDTIKKSYKKNIDYKVEKIKKTLGSVGHNLEVITLTPEAAKKYVYQLILRWENKFNNTF